MITARLKYLITFILPISAWIGFYFQGWTSWLTLIISFGIIPLVESLLPADKSNSVEGLPKHISFFRLLLWLIVPIQWGSLLWFFTIVSTADFSAGSIWGNCAAMGILCGVYGINVAHELGHSTKKFDQFLAKSLLLSSLYMHFFIEHNFGHHKWVGTHEDAATARKNESVYRFWIRSISHGFVSSWEIENQRIKRKKRSFLNHQIAQFVFLSLIHI